MRVIVFFKNSVRHGDRNICTGTNTVSPYATIKKLKINCMELEAFEFSAIKK